MYKNTKQQLLPQMQFMGRFTVSLYQVVVDIHIWIVA